MHVEGYEYKNNIKTQRGNDALGTKQICHKSFYKRTAGLGAKLGNCSYSSFICFGAPPSAWHAQYLIGILTLGISKQASAAWMLLARLLFCKKVGVQGIQLSRWTRFMLLLGQFLFIAVGQRGGRALKRRTWASWSAQISENSWLYLFFC